MGRFLYKLVLLAEGVQYALPPWISSYYCFFAGNPAWECICKQNSWLLEVLSSCVVENTNREQDEYAYNKGQKFKSQKPAVSITLNSGKEKAQVTA